MFEDGWVTGDDDIEYEVLRMKEALGEDGVILRGVMNPIDAVDAANKAYVDDAISETLENIGVGGSMVDIDATLSIPGAAADAKAVGNALGDKLDKTGGTISGHLDVTGGLKVAGVPYFKNLLITENDYAPVVGMRDGGWVNDPEYGSIGILHCHSETDTQQPIIIRGVTNPIQNDDVTNKAYVDDAINAAKEDFSEFITSEATEWKVVDGNGNIIFSVDANGAHTTSITINGKTIQEMIREYVDETILGGAW